MSKLPRLNPIRQETIDFYREGKKLSDYGFLEFLHGYVYSRWPYLYIGMGLGEHPAVKRLKPAVNRFVSLMEPFILKSPDKNNGQPDSASPQTGEESIGFADTYHGKVVPLDEATRLVNINQPIELRELEQVIPYKKARDIIMQDPDHIAVLECPCRSARLNPCSPLDVCLIVGEPFAGMVLSNHPEKSRKITQDEAIRIIQEEDERGHVHHAFFKDAMLGRFYAICNCCSCCCGAMQAQRNGTPMLASSGHVAELVEDFCIGCCDCAGICQFGAISMVSDIPEIDEELCMGCGLCVNNCSQDALHLVLYPEKGTPLKIHELMEEAGYLQYSDG